jgi:ribosome recycling factor
MIADVKKTAEQKMKKSLEALRTDLAKVRTGTARRLPYPRLRT